MDNNLRNKKEELKNEWEGCFNKKIETYISPEGIEAFWDDKTPLDEVALMLDIAAVAYVIEGLSNSLKEKDDDNTKANKLQVFNLKEECFYKKTFDSVNEAKKYIKEVATSTPFTVDDFKIVKVYD